MNSFATLFEASWLPTAPGTYQDRPQSPERIMATNPVSGGSATSTAASVPAARVSGYVPPHLRSGVVGSEAATNRPQFSLAYDAQDKPGRVSSAVYKSSKSEVPAGVAGAEFAPNSKAASKNAKKRANKKKGDVESLGGSNEATEAPIEMTEAPTIPDAETQLEGSKEVESEDKAKRQRALQKKLRQVVVTVVTKSFRFWA